MPKKKKTTGKSAACRNFCLESLSAVRIRMTTSASMELERDLHTLTASATVSAPCTVVLSSFMAGNLYLGAFGTPAVSPVQSLPISNLIRTDIPWKVLKINYLTSFGQCWVVTVLEGRCCSLAAVCRLRAALACLLERWD